MDHVFHRVWMTLEEIERLYPIDRERIGFWEGATLVKHANVGWSSYITPSGTDWFYEAWIKSCARQFDVAFYEHVTGKAAAPLMKLSVIAVRLAWGIR
jgi:hypothetical protein